MKTRGIGAIERGQGVAMMNADSPGVQFVAQLAQRGDCRGISLDHLYELGATRGRLESKRAGARKQVEHLFIGEFASP